MKLIPFSKGVNASVLLIILVSLRKSFMALVNQFEPPDRFAGTLYHALVVFLTIEAARLMTIAFYRPQGGVKKDNFTAGLSQIARIVYALILGVLVLSLFNISMKEAITTLSLLAAALVLITKDYISNLINGMYMTLARIVNIGDTVKIAETKGKIIDITLSNVHLLNEDDDIVYIPNNNVFSSQIINYTRRELKKSSIDFELDIAQLDQLERLEKEIIYSLRDLEELIQPGSMVLKVNSIKHEFCSFKFQYILNDTLNKEHDSKVKRQIISFIMRHSMQTRVRR
ncbi:MAG: mechanosensitive ion channel family protein [Flavobacteriales bacterium]